MSAYLVDKITIDRIISLLSMEKFKEEIDIEKFVPKEDIENLFGTMLWKMNVETLEQKYGDTIKLEPYRFQKVHVSPIQGLKSIQCFLYQCNEGDVSKKVLFKQLDETSKEIAYEIDSDMPSYDKAEWG